MSRKYSELPEDESGLAANKAKRVKTIAAPENGFVDALLLGAEYGAEKIIHHLPTTGPGKGIVNTAMQLKLVGINMGINFLREQENGNPHAFQSALIRTSADYIFDQSLLLAGSHIYITFKALQILEGPACDAKILSHKTTCLLDEMKKEAIKNKTPIVIMYSRDELAYTQSVERWMSILEYAGKTCRKTQEKFQEFINKEISFWAPVIKAGNIKID